MVQTPSSEANENLRVGLQDYLLEGAQNIIRGFPDERRFWVKLLSVIGEGLLIVDAERRVVFFNKRAEEITGFKRDEVLGQPCVLAVRCINCLHECALFERGFVENKTIQFITKRGETISVVKTCAVITDEAGRVLGGIEIFRDVTAEERFQALLAEEKEKLETVLNNIKDGILLISPDGKIAFVNQQVERFTGRGAESLIGRTLADVHGPGRRHLFTDLAAAHGSVVGMRTADGAEIRVELEVAPLRGAGEAAGGILVLFRLVGISDRVRRRLEELHHYHGMISNSPLMIEIFNLVETIADSDVTVLIQGESGTGKELLARALHATSARRDRPFHIVNCSVFNENLLESELFGHCKGAFTGAVADKVGRFEMADGGTLFLDEIGELPPKLQVKLLRFLQDRKFERVGDLRSRSVDVRIIAATNRELRSEIESGRFRDDLYYRLNVIPIRMPPLRARRGDIPTLAEHYLDKICRPQGRSPLTCSDEVMEMLERHRWPGNVRELENVLLYAITCCIGAVILPSHLPKDLRSPLSPPASRPNTAADAERETILEALRQASFSRSRAADLLGITRTTLWRKMRRYGL